ncbi:MAG TPA: hypothetical protein VLL52_26000 [Anaerolineae bacterium]|nr:hypothetical protein [Anaerolineae bacterium]
MLNNQKQKLMANSILWATAIIAAALFDAHAFFTIVLLPLLAWFSITLLQSNEETGRCKKNMGNFFNSSQ